MKKTPTVNCSACNKEIPLEKDVFQISSPYQQADIHSCQRCWNLILIEGFMNKAKQNGIKLTIK